MQDLRQRRSMLAVLKLGFFYPLNSYCTVHVHPLPGQWPFHSFATFFTTIHSWYQCRGSMKFWYGSGCGCGCWSTDPYLGLMDPDSGCGSGSCYLRQWPSKTSTKNNLKKVFMLINRVSDPHWFNADPDTDPDPAFFLIADPDSGSGSRIRIRT